MPRRSAAVLAAALVTLSPAAALAAAAGAPPGATAGLPEPDLARRALFVRARPEPALERAAVLRLQSLVRQVPASSDIVELAARIVLATHPDENGSPERVRSSIRYGASPRGAQALLLTARAHAMLRGRLYVSMEDLVALARPALRHRLILNYEAEASGLSADTIIDDVVQKIAAHGAPPR